MTARTVGLVLAALLLIAACADDDRSASSTTAPAESTTLTRPPDLPTPTTAPGSSAPTPAEDPDPYRADGKETKLNVLTQPGIVRQDITTSFGPASGTAKGVPLTVELTILDASPGAGCKPLAGAAVYVWHADINGFYSSYDRIVLSENHLRGVQAAGVDGVVRFSTRFPGLRSPSWPHVGIQVFPDLATATAAGPRLVMTSMALPRDTADLVYATSGYAISGRALSKASLSTDVVFKDGVSQQMATVSGDVAGGLVAALRVAVTR